MNKILGKVFIIIIGLGLVSACGSSKIDDTEKETIYISKKTPKSVIALILEQNNFRVDTVMGDDVFTRWKFIDIDVNEVASKADISSDTLSDTLLQKVKIRIEVYSDPIYWKMKAKTKHILKNVYVDEGTQEPINQKKYASGYDKFITEKYAWDLLSDLAEQIDELQNQNSKDDAEKQSRLDDELEKEAIEKEKEELEKNKIEKKEEKKKPEPKEEPAVDNKNTDDEFDYDIGDIPD